MKKYYVQKMNLFEHKPEPTEGVHGPLTEWVEVMVVDDLLKDVRDTLANESAKEMEEKAISKILQGSSDMGWAVAFPDLPEESDVPYLLVGPIKNVREASVKLEIEAAYLSIYKKVIRSSNLCLRFYLTDGWTKEELDECCVRGQVSCKHPNDPNPYYTLDSASSFDVEKLMLRCSKVERAFDDNPNESDYEFLTRMNG